jgi:Zn-dependent protease with chaperone function
MAASFPAGYFDGASSTRHAVEVEVDGERVRVRGAGVALDLARADLQVQPRVGKLPVRIALPGGGLLVADAALMGSALPIPRPAGLAHRLESHLGIVLGSVAGVVVAAWLAFTYGIPWAAREIAFLIPPSVETQIAEEGLKALDRYVLKPSALDEGRRQRLSEVFAELSAKAEGAGRGARLAFRDGRWVGANAFALPGGVVVATDQLVVLLQDDDRIAAVLAHEIGHLQHRHGTRHILQDSLVGILALALLGDATAVANIAATIPTVMVHSGYSRDFEREADRFAYGLLRQTGRSPKLLGDALAELERAHEARGATCKADSDAGPGDAKKPDKRSRSSLPDYVSTHPATEERIRAAEEAAR